MSTIARREEQVEYSVEALRERLDPNPYQPRRTVNEESDKALMESIRSIGLLHYPIIREAGERLQTGSGHRRVRCVFALYDAGAWQGHSMKVVVRDLSDKEMALLALAENDARENISPLERYQAWKRMLTEIPDLKQSDIAASSGLAESTVSNGLRLLELPESALQKLESGDLPVRAARDLVAFKEHPDVIERLFQFNEPLNPDSIRANMRIAAEMAGWHRVREPHIDMDAFAQENPGVVMTLPAFESPYGGQIEPAVFVTDKRLFGKAESTARKAAQQAEGKPAEPEHPTHMPKQLQDPVIRREAKRLGVKAGDPAALKAAGSRGKPMLIEKGYGLRDGIHDLRAYWLDNSECGGCAQGARWMLHVGAGMKQPHLVCENKECFKQKRENALTRWQTDFARQAEARDATVVELAAELEATLLQGSEAARAALQGVSAAVMGRTHGLTESLHETGWTRNIPHVNPGYYNADLQAYPPNELSNATRRVSVAGTEIAALLKVDNVHRIEDVTEAMSADDPRWPRITALLLAAAALAGKGWGDRPPLNPEFSPEKSDTEEDQPKPQGARARRREKAQAAAQPEGDAPTAQEEPGAAEAAQPEGDAPTAQEEPEAAEAAQPEGDAPTAQEEPEAAEAAQPEGDAPTAQEEPAAAEAAQPEGDAPTAQEEPEAAEAAQPEGDAPTAQGARARRRKSAQPESDTPPAQKEAPAEAAQPEGDALPAQGARARRRRAAQPEGDAPTVQEEPEAAEAAQPESDAPPTQGARARRRKAAQPEGDAPTVQEEQVSTEAVA